MSNISTSPNQIQVESVQYQAPVSESALSSMGAAINYTLLNAPPVGTIVPSLVTQAQMDAMVGPGYWLLCNGQSCAGSRYAAITGLTTTPNVSGVFLPVGPWQYFPASGNVTGDVNYGNGAFRRVGDSIQVVTGFSSTGPTVNAPPQLRFNLPPGVNINVPVIPQRPYICGTARWRRRAGGFFGVPYDGMGSVQWDGSATDVGVMIQVPGGDGGNYDKINPFSPLNFEKLSPSDNFYCQVDFTIGPILGYGLLTYYYIRVN